MIRALSLVVWYLFRREPEPEKPTSQLDARLEALLEEIWDNHRWSYLKLGQAFETLGSRLSSIRREIHALPKLGEHIIFIAEMGEEAVAAGAQLYRLAGSMKKESYEAQRSKLLTQLEELIAELDEIQVALVQRNMGPLQAKLDALKELPRSEFPQ